MFTPTQIEIIKHFGSKELSEGCIVRDLYRDSQPIWKYLCDWKYLYEWNIWFIPDNEMTDWWEIENIFEILWHIPELFPDFARVAEEKWLSYYISTDSDFIKVIIAIWEKYPYDEKIIPYIRTLPLIDQDEQLTLIPLLNLLWQNKTN